MTEGATARRALVIIRRTETYGFLVFVAAFVESAALMLSALRIESIFMLLSIAAGAAAGAGAAAAAAES